PMTIKKISSEEHGLRVPHMGWENVAATNHSILFSKIPKNTDFYFAHSYYATYKTEDKSMVVATCEYGHHITAAVEKDNIFATQFHPEKSQRYGLQLLQNFFVHCEEHVKRGDKSC
ncbi:MAG: imidazole glycerol phosphate synthase subunit HisH, partial [bacterium]|nr:imidazole glycerol phosphate synthase subunit HisH [bacterium]